MCRQVYRYIVRYDSNCIFSLKLISYSWFLGVINLFAPRERKQETALKRGERKGKGRMVWGQTARDTQREGRRAGDSYAK